MLKFALAKESEFLCVNVVRKECRMHDEDQYVSVDWQLSWPAPNIPGLFFRVHQAWAESLGQEKSQY